MTINNKGTIREERDEVEYEFTFLAKLTTRSI